MTLLINDQDVNFTLEGGECASDIYKSVNSFLKESGHLIYSFCIDGIETDPENQSIWQNKKTSEIEKIEITALTEKEFLLTGLLTVAEYINLLTRAITEDSLGIIDDLMTEYPSIAKNIPVLIKGTRGLLIADHLTKILKNSGLLNEGLKTEYRDTILTEIAQITELINSEAREIENPQTELISSISVLENLIPQLNDVSILLQTGKDQQAMTLIIALTELLQKILRLISIFNTDNLIIDNKKYDPFSAELNSTLNELAEAFDAKDSVLIGDLLEYEITPKLEMLFTVVKSIKVWEEE